jgi:hypothetical protein
MRNISFRRRHNGARKTEALPTLSTNAALSAMEGQRQARADLAGHEAVERANPIIEAIEARWGKDVWERHRKSRT